MSDPGAVLIAATVIGGATLSIRALAAMVIRMAELRANGNGAGNRINEARLERIEHAVDAIAVEVERISENQRFTTKLLNERAVSS